MSYFKVVSQLLLGGILVDAVMYVAIWIWDRKRTKKTNLERQIEGETKDGDSIYHHALFFPESKLPCRFYYENSNGCKRKNCEFSHKAALLEHLILYLNKAKKTIDICVYLITCPELCAAILKMRSRGDVRIRVITDRDNSDQSNPQIGRLRAEGIAIRCNQSDFLMHHKFVIIDHSILINGSFNWTWKAITGNHENICITNDPSLVEQFQKEFITLWNKFDPELPI